MHPRITVVIPTRERAQYLRHSIRTCLASRYPHLELLILDNASRDETPAVVGSFADQRIRYLRSEQRLSMRDNFERGLVEARGDFIGIIGDDDGIFPHTPERVVALFEAHGVEAVSAARAHYSWPDLLANRRDCGLLPRGSRGRVTVSRSRQPLRQVLRDNDYYKLPCIYHGFVARSAIERFSERHGRFLLSSIADVASTFALCIDDIPFLWTSEPLVINGGSARSNGASHLGGGGHAEKASWQVEDDLGFLPGFDGFKTVGSLLVESALRYQRAENIDSLGEILDLSDVRQALMREFDARRAASSDLQEALQMFAQAGVAPPAADERAKTESRREAGMKRVRSFAVQRPIDFSRSGVSDIFGAMQMMAGLRAEGKTSVLNDPAAQLQAAVKMTRR